MSLKGTRVRGKLNSQRALFQELFQIRNSKYGNSKIKNLNIIMQEEATAGFSISNRSTREPA